MVNAILNGCNGAMGRVITDIVSKDDGIRIVAGVDVNPLKLADYEVYETLDQCPAADVVIDFSSAKATDGVAFGAAMPETENNMHGPDEFAVIDELLMSAKIFAQVIVDLCC